MRISNESVGDNYNSIALGKVDCRVVATLEIFDGEGVIFELPLMLVEEMTLSEFSLVIKEINELIERMKRVKNELKKEENENDDIHPEG